MLGDKVLEPVCVRAAYLYWPITRYILPSVFPRIELSYYQRETEMPSNCRMASTVLWNGSWFPLLRFSENKAKCSQVIITTSPVMSLQIRCKLCISSDVGHITFVLSFEHIVWGGSICRGPHTTMSFVSIVLIHATVKKKVSAKIAFNVQAS